MSATVPMEFSFGAGGSLKSAKRLRNLEFKRNRPATNPSFANVSRKDTGSLIRNAYVGKGGSVGALNQMPKTMPSIHGKNSVPIPVVADTMMGSQDSGGQLMPRESSMNPVIPSPAPMQQTTSNGGSKKLLVIGGGVALLIAFVYFFVLDKKGKRRKRRSR